jgi:hypothetical protein
MAHSLIWQRLTLAELEALERWGREALAYLRELRRKREAERVVREERRA